MFAKRGFPFTMPKAQPFTDFTGAELWQPSASLSRYDRLETVDRVSCEAGVGNRRPAEAGRDCPSAVRESEAEFLAAAGRGGHNCYRLRSSSRRRRDRVDAVVVSSRRTRISSARVWPAGMDAAKFEALLARQMPDPETPRAHFLIDTGRGSRRAAPVDASCAPRRGRLDVPRRAIGACIAATQA
jgi:hypothetical protein